MVGFPSVLMWVYAFKSDGMDKKNSPVQQESTGRPSFGGDSFVPVLAWAHPNAAFFAGNAWPY